MIAHPGQVQFVRSDTTPGELGIVLISEEFPPEMIGGIATYTLDVARGLANLGHRVHVISRTWDTKESFEEIDGVQVHRTFIPDPSWRWGTRYVSGNFHGLRELLFWNRRVRCTLDRILGAESIDVIECPEYHAQGLESALCHPGVPVIVRLHIPAFVCRRLNGVGIGASPLDTRLCEMAEYQMSRRAALITSPSRIMADDVAGPWKIERSSIRVIPNPADERLFASADHIEPEPDTVVFAGRIERRKGVETLAAAIPLIRRQRPNARFRFYGADHPSGPAGMSMVQYLRGMLNAAGVPESAVVFYGPQHRHLLPPIYRGAWVCAVPSLYESFGYTCLEAMAAGSAVVASNAGSIPELLTHGHDGLLVPPSNARALADGIVRLLSEPSLRHQLAAEARRTVMERFARDKVCQQMVNAYREAVRRHR